MKFIYIARHAKSSWAYDEIRDVDRPLKKRGIQDAYLMAKLMQKEITHIDAFIASHATRALSTATIFASVLNFPLSNLCIKKSLYDFSNGYLVKVIKALDDNFKTIIIFGHDHGISNFVNEFGDQRIEHIPTCGVVGIEFDIAHWKNIKKGKTKRIAFPKQYRKK